MGKAAKWILIVIGSLVAIVVLALLIIPLFVDVQKYKPEIEKQVSEATGRPCTLGGDLTLSLFPWAGLSFSDLHLGNLPGFAEKDLLSVRSFEVRVKLIPLLFKDVQVKRFILDGPRVVLEKAKNGRGNWEDIGKAAGQIPPKAPEERKRTPESKSPGGLPIKTLAVGEFAITNGSVLWIDHVKGERREISALTLRLGDVSLDRPIKVALSAQLDKRPLSLEGSVGPVGKDPGKGTIPLILMVKALAQLQMSVEGKVSDPATHPQFDLAFAMSSFSPRTLLADLGEPLPVQTADPKVLNNVAVKCTLSGNPENISVSDGVLTLDESKIDFSVKAKDFSKPDVVFQCSVDDIDLDRYLPPPAQEQAEEEQQEKAGPANVKQEKTDYTPLRSLVLDGTFRVDKLKAYGARIQDVYGKVWGKDGRFKLDPLTLKLYQGSMSSNGALDIQSDIPATKLELRAEGIQVGPLLKDVLEKDFLEGTLRSEVGISMVGDDPESMKSSLDGQGDLLFSDGAIVGIDLAGMVRNVKATFGLAEEGEKRPRTDFTELHAPFAIAQGVVDTPGTSLTSPLLRVLVAGKANLLDETLDFRVEPKFVATLAGQGDAVQRAGIMVPILVTGTFTSPKFRPDLKDVIRKELEERLPVPSELKKILPGQGAQEGKSRPVEEQAKDLLKGLPFGR